MSQECRLGLGKNFIKKQSIYSGSFGNYKPGYNFTSSEDMDLKISEDQLVDSNPILLFTILLLFTISVNVKKSDDAKSTKFVVKSRSFY